MKNQKGITLIALVVTIIVLLILAGISIAMLTGDNGIIINAQKASTFNAYYAAEEQVKIAYMSVRTEIMVQNVKDGTYDARTSTSAAKLAQLVKKDLQGSGWKVTYTPVATSDLSDSTKKAVIYVEYKDASIDKSKIDASHPAEEGYVHYSITLTDQGATVETDIGATNNVGTQTV